MENGIQFLPSLVYDERKDLIGFDKLAKNKRFQ